MTELDKKVLDLFPGKVVRKDLTALMKKGANVPTYVLEYLLGMYCATDDEEAIQIGIEKIKKILSENYVRPDQSEYVKSKIRENGQYTIIDKITVELDEREDKYVARFTNLSLDPFEVSSDLVIHNEKLLVGGIWCIIKIEYVGLEKQDDQEQYEEDIFGNKKHKKQVRKKKSRYDSPFEIASLKPIQMPNLDLDEIKESRAFFSKEEWIALLMRSAGYEPTELSTKQQLHYLLRFVPFIQKNYNLVELGPRGTGKSHVYSELSPYSILMSSGTTTVSNMFYNMSSRRVGLVGNWDCIAFDEVAGITQASGDMVQIMKNYMANGSFARGSDSISSDASIAFEGNTFRSVADMMRTTNLFEPFPEAFNNFLFFGIEKFIIRDQKTDECIFTTARFYDGEEDFDMPAFETFCTRLNRDPDIFYEGCRAGKYADRPKTDLAQRKMEKEQAAMEQIGKDCVYRRFHQLVGPLPPYYGPSKPVIKKKAVIPLEQTGLTYTVTLTTKPKSEPMGNKKYDLYEAIAHYKSGNDIVIDGDAKELEYDALLKRWCLWDNILYALSNENTMREVLEMAQKKKDGTLMPNRIVRIACDSIVTDKGNTLQFIAKPKDGKTLEIYPKARTFNPAELVLIETDYFASHPEYWAEWLA